MTATIYDDGQEYDLLGGAYAAGEELDFYLSQSAYIGGNVLELACGTGRITVPLAQRGIEITGIDTEAAMLEVARAKAERAGVCPNFVNADVRSFSLNAKFDLVFFPKNSLVHLHSLPDIQACFSCVRQHLMTDGLFVIDLFNPSLPILMRDATTHYPVAEYLDDSGRRVVVTETSQYEAATQINKTHWHYQREGQSTEVRLLEMRVFFPQEIAALLVLNGFKIEAKYGDYSGSPFANASQQQLILCRKSH